jgi:hypothetical protein
MMCVSPHIEQLGASNEIGPAVHPGKADFDLGAIGTGRPSFATSKCA